MKLYHQIDGRRIRIDDCNFAQPLHSVEDLWSEGRHLRCLGLGRPPAAVAPAPGQGLRRQQRRPAHVPVRGPGAHAPGPGLVHVMATFGIALTIGRVKPTPRRKKTRRRTRRK